MTQWFPGVENFDPFEDYISLNTKLFDNLRPETQEALKEVTEILLRHFGHCLLMGISGALVTKDLGLLKAIREGLEIIEKRLTEMSS